MLSIAHNKLLCITVFLSSFALTNPGYAAPNAMLAPVTTMYRNFAWQALSSDTDIFGNCLDSQPARTLSQYFDPHMAKLIAEDAECQRRTQAFCKLDFDILFDSQDPRVVDLRIAARSSNKVDVKFKDPVSDEQTVITYTVSRRESGWRINDVTYWKGSRRTLRAVLSGSSDGFVKRTQSQ